MGTTGDVIATSVTYQKKTFANLCKAVLSHIDTTIPIIQESYNEFLREHGLDKTKREKRDITVTATDNFLLDYDIITIHEVYLNDEQISCMDYKDYLEGTYTTNGSYTIFDGYIYFPGNLAATDTLYIIASVTFTEDDDFERTDVLDIPNFWFNVAVNYICKELFAEPEDYDANQIARFEHKYNMGYADAISQKLEIEGVTLEVFDDLETDYDWEE